MVGYVLSQFQVLRGSPFLVVKMASASSLDPFYS